MPLPERLQVILSLKAGQYKREARAVSSATGKITDNAMKAGSATAKLKDTFRKWSGEIKLFLALKAAQAIKAFIGNAIEANKNLAESQNAVNKIFKESADVIHEFGQISAQVAGLSTREFNELSVGIGGLLQNLGFDAESAATETIRLTLRAGDLASVLNTSVGEALMAIGAGLRGENEQLRRFNIQLSQAEINEKAVALGLAETTSEVDRNARAQATLALIYEQSADAQGDFIQTSSDLANAQRVGAAEAENAQARFGAALVPVTTALQNQSTLVLLSVQALGLFGDANATVAQQSLRTKEAIDNVNEALREGDDPYTALADSLLHIAANGELTEGTFLALAASVGLLPDQFEDFSAIVVRQAEALGIDKDVIMELEAAMGQLPAAAGGAAGGLGEVGDAASEAGGDLMTAAEAQRAVISAMLEAANPAFAAAKAAERQRAAEEKLIEVQADHEASERDIAEAQLASAEATLESQAALDAFDASGVTEGASAIAEALDISTREAKELLEILGILDGQTFTTVVQTQFREGRVSSAGAPPIGTQSQRRHGGPTTRLMQVGEANRPELLMIPGDRGQVFSNQDMKALIAAFQAAASGGRGDTSFTFNNSMLANDPRQAVRSALAFDALGNL